MHHQTFRKHRKILNNMPDNKIDYTDIQNTEQNDIFHSDEEMRQSLSRLCYGDLYVIGRIWIEALKTGLLGSKWSLVPVIEAAVEKPPEKPPPMRYKDLPLYSSPHYEYKDYVADKDKCPKAKVKLAHEIIFPYVRKSLGAGWCDFRSELKEFKNEIGGGLSNKKNQFKCYMRCPDNLTIRQAIVTFGGVAGYYIGSARGLPTRFITTGLGLLGTGALCFPKETDNAFRSFTYQTGKIAISLYNSYCHKMFSLRERVPCPADVPPPPKAATRNYCPVKK